MLPIHKDVLIENHVYLIANLPSDELFEQLVRRKVVSLRQVSRFKLNKIREDQIGELLTHLPTCNDDAFDHLCESLDAIGKEDVRIQLRATEMSMKRKNNAGSTEQAQPTHDDDIDLFEADSPMEVRVTRCSQDFYKQKKSNSYAMDRKPRGIALIVNVKGISGMENRTGTDVDCANLHQLWTELDFKVIVYNDEDDLTTEGIKKKVTDLAKSKDLYGSQCLTVCLLSHGKNGQIYGTEGQTLNINTLKQHFNNENCPALQNVPKLWFVQACRGDRADAGVEFEVDGASDIVVADDPGQQPILSDFFVAYPTAAGYKAWRNKKNGSFFIQALVKVFQKYAATEDLCAMMHKVNDVVSRKVTDPNAMQFEARSKSQMPDFNSALRKMHLYFFPGICKP